jgi:predicted acetyltransferase
VTLTIRELGPDDAAAAWSLSSLAFGYHDRPMPPEWGDDRPGRHLWGVFDGDGRLLAKALDREQAHWFGGRSVPASGVAGVAVAAEARGGGLGRTVLTRLLAAARDRGAVISTLFPTTAVPYRRLGWEEVGALVNTAVLAMVLDPLPAPAGITTRAATVDDVAAMRDIYAAVARAGTGMMDRSGPLYDRDPADVINGWNGTTVAVGAGGVVGYATWDRGGGYDASGRIEVGDLMAVTADAAAALLGMLRRWASVAPTLVFRQGGADPLPLLTALGVQGRVERRQPWMLRLVDVARAVAARGWSPFLKGTVDIALTDAECPWNAGEYRLVLDGGEGRWEPGGTGRVRFTPRALAAWYAGAAAPAVLRRAGLLDGPDDDDAFLAVATAGPEPTLLDYF